MRTLIIHPDDRSTDFLRGIYCYLKDATVVVSDVSQTRLHKLIRSHDQIVMLGHGSPSGLFNVARVGGKFFTIGSTEADMLRDKQCIFIWCHADQYVRKHGLRGLSSGMFISEVSEARYCQVSGNQEQVDHSNEVFARALGAALVAPGTYQQVLKQVTCEYEILIAENAVAKYNLERWQLIG